MSDIVVTRRLSLRVWWHPWNFCLRSCCWRFASVTARLQEMMLIEKNLDFSTGKTSFFNLRENSIQMYSFIGWLILMMMMMMMMVMMRWGQRRRWSSGGGYKWDELPSEANCKLKNRHGLPRQDLHRTDTWTVSTEHDGETEQHTSCLFYLLCVSNWSQDSTWDVFEGALKSDLNLHDTSWKTPPHQGIPVWCRSWSTIWLFRSSLANDLMLSLRQRVWHSLAFRAG